MAKKRSTEPDWKKRPPGFDVALMNMVRAIRLFNKRNPQGQLTFTLSWNPTPAETDCEPPRRD